MNGIYHDTSRQLLVSRVTGKVKLPEIHLDGKSVNQELGFGRPRSVVRFPRGSNVWHHQHDENEPKHAPILGRVERKSVGALAKIVEHFKCRFCGRKRLRTSRIRKTRLRF